MTTNVTTLAGSTFESPAMAGVGVIYYVLGAVRAALKQAGWFEARPIPNLADWLDLVAVGTVADVVPLDRNNRVMISQGRESPMRPVLMDSPGASRKIFPDLHESTVSVGSPEVCGSATVNY